MLSLFRRRRIFQEKLLRDASKSQAQGADGAGAGAGADADATRSSVGSWILETWWMEYEKKRTVPVGSKNTPCGVVGH